MLAAGVVLMIASMIAGEKLTALPSLSGFLAVGYLALFGSIIAINAYMYLIRNVSPALATSYAYVNPVVAVLLGTGLGGETLSKIEWLALGVIVFAVVLVTLGKYLFPAKPVVAPVIQTHQASKCIPCVSICALAPSPQIHSSRRSVSASSFSFSRPRNAHSQTINTRQPSSCKRLISRRSRSTFLPIFSSQNSVRVAGTLNR
ncbi:putative DMT superfamily transporter inner membrane protein [Escherichia coli]|nr:putative DMT superfamily transporter inner membrane protein [Escherichia coli]